MIIETAQTIIDEDLIVNAINDYIDKHDDEPYLFMSKETMNYFSDICECKCECECCDCSNDDIAMVEYMGCSVFENNDLDFGEIELR